MDSLDKSDSNLEKLHNQILDYCEWMGQRAFIYPNWQDRREAFLNENWHRYLDFALEAIGDPFMVNSNDLKKILLTYQHHSYLNSLTRVFSGLIAQEFAQNEKIIWSGVIEDLGERSVKAMGIPNRKASTHYLLLTEKSLLIKSSNRNLTQKFPVHELELEPFFSNGLRITEPVWHPERDDLRIEAFSSYGALNGHEVMQFVYDSNGQLIGHEYTDVFMKMIAAFAITAHLFDLKEELLSEETSDD